MELYPFNALLARMKYIARWGLMRAARTESLSEHTADAAILAHTLCLVSQTIFGTDVRPETVAVAALYHDASEILTGDMPTPVKYKSEPLRAAYKAVEADAAHTLGALLPDAVRAGMDGYLSGGILTQKERQLLKAADRLSALIKCVEEENAGNREFAGARAQQTAALSDHLEQASAAVVVVLVFLKMLVEMVDALGQNGNLHFGGAGIGLMDAIGFDEFLLASHGVSPLFQIRPSRSQGPRCLGRKDPYLPKPRNGQP